MSRLLTAFVTVLFLSAPALADCPEGKITKDDIRKGTSQSSHEEQGVYRPKVNKPA